VGYIKGGIGVFKMAVSSEFWTNGKQDAPVCICTDDYGHKVIAYASSERITANELKAALEAEYPDIEFETMTDVSPGSIHAIGQRVL